MKNLEKYTLQELKVEKQRLQKVINSVIIGTLIYASIIFYFMYNDPNNDGRLLILVPIAVLFIIMNIAPRRARVHRLINSKK